MPPAAGEGKVPRRSGQDQKRQNAVLKLRAQLRGAIAGEDYEAAAHALGV